MNAITQTVDNAAGMCHTLSPQAVDHFGDIDCGRYMNPWFCVQTEPKSEHLALLALSELRFRAYLPKVVVRQVRYGKREEVIRPLFPGYLFVSFDMQDEWGLIYRVRGVSRIMSGPSGKPIALRLGEIEHVMASGRAGDGVIDDEAPVFPMIDPGASVRITGGPMTDWSGVCAWSTEKRIGVLMTMFNAERVVPMDRCSVVVV